MYLFADQVMAILEIIEVPHSLLAKRAREVRADEFGAALAAHMGDMAETMYAAPGVGLAAPQVADSRCILVIDPGFEGEDGENQKGRDLYKMVNPRITQKSSDTILWEESCLSVPEMTIEVKRHRQVTVQWQDALGSACEKVFENFDAVVVQHELDHLEGVTLLERSSRLKRSRYLKRQKKRLQV
jgi:peptide deformylase